MMNAASHIMGPFWMGSDPTGYRAKLAPFGIIVACAEELPYGPQDFPAHIVVRAPLDDDPNADASKMRRTLFVARTAVNSVVAKIAKMALKTPPRRASRVLVTCHMGLNRSGLVTALLLHQLYPQAPGRNILATIRAKRHRLALSNPLFEAVVLGL